MVAVLGGERVSATREPCGSSVIALLYGSSIAI
jgi:hypothetical protein